MDNELNMNDDNQMPMHESKQPILAMAFVNMQPLDEIYNFSDSFNNGTLFPNLNKPFLAGGMKL